MNDPDFELWQITTFGLRYDGAAHHHAVICAGMRGEVATRHGAPDRWDWGVTLSTLGAAQDRHRRLESMLDEMTTDQRAELWAESTPLANELRRVARMRSA